MNEREQMLRDIRQLIKEAPQGKRLAFVERYLDEQESLLQAQPHVAVDGESLLTIEDIDGLEHGEYLAGRLSVQAETELLKAQDAKTRQHLAQLPSASIEAVLKKVKSWIKENADELVLNGLEASMARQLYIVADALDNPAVRQRLSLPQPAPTVAAIIEEGNKNVAG